MKEYNEEVLKDVEKLKEKKIQEESNDIKRKDAFKDGEEEISLAARKTILEDSVNKAASVFQKAWDEKVFEVVVGGGGFGAPPVMITTSLKNMKSMFTGKKRSGAAVELARAAQSFFEATGGKIVVDEPSSADKIKMMLSLYMTSTGYVNSHGSPYTTEGQLRTREANALADLMKTAVKNMTTDKDEEDIKDNTLKPEERKESLDSVQKIMKRAAKGWESFSNQLGKSISAYTPEEMLKRKLEVLKNYEVQIKRYRSEVPEAEWGGRITRMIRDYEDCIRWEKVMAFTNAHLEVKKEGEQKKTESIEKVINKHLEQEGEIEQKDNLKKEEIDEGLSEEQLKGIQEIDTWLIRNAANGGLFGIKNEHADFVSAILALSKRERLHMYYLVETDARKNP
ncbi:MAG: hypothetical protein K6A69_06180, partial [Lachnospiraceae bacterium]|nr:hypothetical protein [Lachnospiraceae bacterium]